MKMPKAISIDLRTRVVEQAAKGMSIKKIQKTFGISRATAYRWIKRKKDRGDVKATEQARPGNRHSILPEEYEEFKEMVNNNRGKNAKEFCKLWKREISSSSMKRYLKKLGFTLKKNNSYMSSVMKRSEKYSERELRP
jgi:transposase